MWNKCTYGSGISICFIVAIGSFSNHLPCWERSLEWMISIHLCYGHGRIFWNDIHPFWNACVPNYWNCGLKSQKWPKNINSCKWLKRKQRPSCQNLVPSPSTRLTVNTSQMLNLYGHLASFNIWNFVKISLDIFDKFE